LMRDKKWITPALILCSQNKNKLHKQWLNSQSSCDEEKCKNYR